MYWRRSENQAGHHGMGGLVRVTDVSANLLLQPEQKQNDQVSNRKLLNYGNINKGLRDAPLGPRTWLADNQKRLMNERRNSPSKRSRLNSEDKATNSSLTDFPALTSTPHLTFRPDVLKDFNHRGSPRPRDTQRGIFEAQNQRAPLAVPARPIISTSIKPKDLGLAATETSFDLTSPVTKASEKVAQKSTAPGVSRLSTSYTIKDENQYQGLPVRGRTDVEEAEMAVLEAAAKFNALPDQLKAKIVQRDEDGEIRAAIISMESAYCSIATWRRNEGDENTQPDPSSRSRFPILSSLSNAGSRNKHFLEDTIGSRGIEVNTTNTNIFRRICEVEGAGKMALTEADISVAFEFCCSIDLYGCVKTLNALILHLSEYVLRDSDRPAILGMDSPKIILQRLTDPSDSGSDTGGYGKLRSFRKAWDLVSLVESVDYELGIALQDKNNQQISSYKDLGRKWGFIDEENSTTPNVNWTELLEQGRVWKNWCKAFSSGRIQDRGIILLLAAIQMESGDPALSPFARDASEFQYSDYAVKGGSLKSFQIRWIEKYAFECNSSLGRLAQFLDPWAATIFKRDWIGAKEKKRFRNGIQELLCPQGFSLC